MLRLSNSWHCTQRLTTTEERLDAWHDQRPLSLHFDRERNKINTL